jgi:ATP adenylyltransferase
MDRLFSPWRLRYVASEKRASSGCVFCRAIRRGSDRDNLILYRGDSHFVILNKYPYNNGHLMIVPMAHLASPSDAAPESLTEMMALAVHCESALRSIYRPTGINLGMNLGRSAGAGIAGHYHLHVLPRWDGDTNFMTVVHGTRVIPESLRTSWGRLRPAFDALEKSGHAERGRAGRCTRASARVLRPAKPRRRRSR